MPTTGAHREGVPRRVEARVDDVEAASRFYGDLFGWTFDHGPTGSKRGHLRGRAVAGIAPRPTAAETGGIETPSVWLTYLHTDDVDEAARRVLEAGGALLLDPSALEDDGRMAVAVDPTGAAFALWEGGREPDGPEASGPGTLAWSECVTRDSAKAAEFYTTVFGFTCERLPHMPHMDYTDYTTLYADGRPVAGIMGIGDEWPPEVPPHWAVLFTVADTDAAVAAIEAGGGRLVIDFGVPTRAFDTPHGRIAVAVDCCGADFIVLEPTEDHR